MPRASFDLIALGGGTAGLVTAAGAASLGARVALVERVALGGDCLWTGCVPSKALLASARLAQRMRRARDLGLEGADPPHNFPAVMDRMRAARARIAHHDDPERFRQMGVAVIQGPARFIGPAKLEVAGYGVVQAPRIVIATGAQPWAPPIPGLEETGYLTHVSAVESNDLPAAIVIVGGGPVGLEFAQAYARLGSRVTLLEQLPEILPGEDPDVSAAVRHALEQEGIEIVTGARTASAERSGGAVDGGKWLETADGRRFGAAEIFVAVGRRPAIDALEPHRAGIEIDGGAVRVNHRLETSARGVWAAGDVASPLQFTHVAEHMARVAVQNALVPLKRSVDYRCVPRVTYTDPEVAHVGLSEAAAAERGGTTYRYDFRDLDRAIVDAEPRGFAKVSADRRGRILGATIVGASAGELIMPLVLAMEHGISLSRLARTVFPYPTLVEVVKRAVDVSQRARLEGPGGRFLKRVVRWLV